MKKQIPFILPFFFLSFGAVFSIAGGISGGGGDVISPNKPTTIQNPEAVEHMILKSRPLFNKYVQKKYNDLLGGKLSSSETKLYSKLFRNKVSDLNSVLKKYDLYIDEKSSCYASDRKPVDGSIFSPVPDTVCLSAVSIAEKVHYSEIPKQSVALMLHEFSELSGLEEEDAVILQKNALIELK